MSETPWIQLREQAQRLLEMADFLEREAETGDSRASDTLLGLRELREEFGFSRESLASAARDGLPVSRGPRGRLCAFRQDVEAWIRSRSWRPGTRRQRGSAESSDPELVTLRQLATLEESAE